MRRAAEAQRKSRVLLVTVISLLRARSSSTKMEEYVEVTCQGRGPLQLKTAQMTVSNLAKTFRLVAETILLISSSGTVAIPDDDGTFPDLNPLLQWTVEGDQVTHNVRSLTPLEGTKVAGTNGKERCRPQVYRDKGGYRLPGDHAGPSTSSQGKQVCRYGG